MPFNSTDCAHANKLTTIKEGNFLSCFSTLLKTTLAIRIKYIILAYFVKLNFIVKESTINNNDRVIKVSDHEPPDQFFENRIVPEFLNTKLAAQYLGISENALRIKVCRGQVPHFKFGRQLRFKTQELKKMILRKD